MDYAEALAEVEKLIALDPDPDTKEAVRLNELSHFIEKYEREHFPFGVPDQIEAVKFRIAESGVGTDPTFYELASKDSCLGKDAILVAFRGSVVHGMYAPSNEPNSIDDLDIMSICIPTLDNYFGLKKFGSRGTKEIKEGKWDIVVYELRKFIRLLIQDNPNVLSMLWVDPRLYLHQREEGRALIAARSLFVGRHVYKSFVGYAYGQAHRMEHAACKGYMGEKRKALVNKYGYDTKSVAHLIRLLRMGVEFLTTGEMHKLCALMLNNCWKSNVENGLWSKLRQKLLPGS